MNPPNPNSTLTTTANLGTLAISTLKSFSRRHKVLTASYLYGLAALCAILLLGSGTKLSLDQRRKYDRIMSSIDLQAEYTAASRYHSAYANYYASKGWFSCDAHCQHYKSLMKRRKLEWDEVKAEGNARMSDAKAVAGLFSEVGVSEVQDSFWEYFHAGKRFAKRQSMWDAMFMGMRSMGRDESMVEYMFKMLLQVLINFSMGLIMALVIFVFGLWGIIQSYQPNPLTGVIFFVTAACAGFAFVSTYLMMLYGAAAGGVYGLVKMAESNARIEGGRGYDRQRIQRPAWEGNRNRPHYQ
ncbi:hypothetical protein ACHAW6_007880 [Cyclotella cf. meneghiniana]